MIDWPLDLLPNISFTQIRMLRRCPEQYRRRYVLGEKTLPAINLIWGSADHAGIELDLRSRIERGQGEPLDLVLDAAGDAWYAQIEQAGGLENIDLGADGSDLTTANDRKLASARLRERMLRLCSLYHGQVCPTLEPVAVEDRFQIQLPGLPVPLDGVVDIVERSRMRERKTAGRASIGNDLRLQGRIYQLAHDLPMHWDVSVRAEKPRVVDSVMSTQVPTATEKEVTKRIVSDSVNLIGHLLATYGIEHPWPDGMSHEWACKLCGWGPYGNDSCRWWKR